MTDNNGLYDLAIQNGIRKPWYSLLMMTKTPYGLYAFTHKDLEHFAALVAAHEREACAKVCDGQGSGRKALEHYAALTYVGATHDCAAAIRARGEHYPCKPDIFEMTYERVEE